MELHLAGIKPPPLGSVQDSIYRTTLAKQQVRELRKLSMIVLSQGGIKDGSIADMFQEHTEDLLYTGNIRKREERSLRRKYATEMQNTAPKIHRQKDGSVVVTGL